MGYSCHEIDFDELESALSGPVSLETRPWLSRAACKALALQMYGGASRGAASGNFGGRRPL